MIEDDLWTIFREDVSPPEASSKPEEPPCAECKGTGEYVGLNVVEPCRACPPPQAPGPGQPMTCGCGSPMRVVTHAVGPFKINPRHECPACGAWVEC